MEIDKDFNVITDNSKVNINLLKQIETLKAENCKLVQTVSEWVALATDRKQENTKLEAENKELREVLKGHERVLQSVNMDLAVERKRTSKAVGKNLELIEENTKLKELLREVESQLNDRGGFDILRASINEVITS